MNNRKNAASTQPNSRWRPSLRRAAHFRPGINPLRDGDWGLSAASIRSKRPSTRWDRHRITRGLTSREKSQGDKHD